MVGVETGNRLRGCSELFVSTVVKNSLRVSFTKKQLLTKGQNTYNIHYSNKRARFSVLIELTFLLLITSLLITNICGCCQRVGEMNKDNVVPT